MSIESLLPKTFPASMLWKKPEASKPGIQKIFASHPHYQVAYMPRSYTVIFKLTSAPLLLQHSGKKNNNKDLKNHNFPLPHSF